jgi:hypothetical protein
MANPHFQLSQCAQDWVQPSDHPCRSSNSAMSFSQRWWAALMRPAKVQISAASSVMERMALPCDFAQLLGVYFTPRARCLHQENAALGAETPATGS